jgi:hypothetical protein
MSSSKEDVSNQKVKEQSDDLRTKYPIFTAILERIPDMDLKEALSVLVIVDPVRSLLKTRATRLSFIGEDKNLDQIIDESISQLKTKHALMAGILERIHKMDLKDTAIGILGIDAMESLLKLRMLVLVTS